MTNPGIAIVGLGCRYPDAASPSELWENVLAQRRAFRRIPEERLSRSYYSPDPHAPDKTYAMTAAVIEDYEFDRIRHRVSGVAYRSADLVHWLALDIAGRALADAGWAEGKGLPRRSTAVYLGNTLTGEFSRAATMRLRWPYVQKVVAAALAERGIGAEERAGLLRDIEDAYKRPFAEVGEETLAGGLSNTIAGRIANHFDFNGGGYTVDGACASSLLAVATACSALAAGDCDAALAGGVDLSLDPFELIGFAKAGALAAERMRVYDVRSAGFWPGEGCGFAMLMRYDDAIASGRRIYAVVRGWGISSDGSGGITRPEADGQLLALERAYRRAGFGADSVAYFEGHGTGTAVGDATELRALAMARRGASTAAAISSVKANIGHTKAAAGIAGVIKAAMAVDAQVIPPVTGCDTPHPEMSGMLRVARSPELWPGGMPVRAAVSAMGFGGINCHIVMEGVASGRQRSLTALESRLAASSQDAELFLFSKERLAEGKEIAAGLSLSELTDYAASLSGAGDAVCAVVASTPQELAQKLASAQARLVPRRPRIGFLFPGQGSQNSAAATEIAQPAIVRDSLRGLRELRALGIEAEVAVGHSLGEIAALCWAGAIDEDTAVRIATERGRIMAALPGGAMAALRAGEQEVKRLIGDEAVAIAGYNGERQTVISGAQDAIGRVVARTGAIPLAVTHAFHSPMMAGAAEPFGRLLAAEHLRKPSRRVISTVTAAAIGEDDLRELLVRQLTAPVRFYQAISAAPEVDLWIEVGPGRVLSGLVRGQAVSIEWGSGSRRPFLEAVAAAVNAGTSLDAMALFADRFTRPFQARRKFFASPCELDSGVQAEPVRASEPEPIAAASTPLAVLRELIGSRAELPASAVQENARLLADLHLSSIVVAQIATEAARRLELPPPPAPLQYAGLTVAEMAEALEASAKGPRIEESSVPAGVDAWVRPFVTRLERRPLPGAAGASNEDGGEWKFFGDVPQSLGPLLPASGGVVLAMPAPVPVMIEAAQTAVRLRRPARFILVQHDGNSAALARTVFLEARDLPVCVVNLPPLDPRAAERIAAEASSVRHYTEVHYGADGVRREPVMSAASFEPREFPLGPDDTLLVTGGAKGIGAECAIEAARVSGAKLLLVGTSRMEDNPNLQRMRAMGLQFEYRRADVTDPASLTGLEGVTAILHCAGVNQPRSIDAVDEAGFRRTLAVKVDGLRNVLAAVDPARLKLVAAFGSIIGRIGLAGELDYAIANEWLARDVEAFGAAHPHCRCLTFEFSVWSGAGMGERVAHLESMMRAGVSLISIEEGVAAFRSLLASDARGSIVVSGRFGPPATMQFDRPGLPLLRYLENVRVHYPGVELVCEATLSGADDPYLDDHIFSGARLLPGVMALEAMAQAAMAVTGSTVPPAFENVRFLRPIIVPQTGELAIRLAALVRPGGEVEVCIRTADTQFQADHFRAICRFEAREGLGPSTMPADEAIPLDPGRHLYGGLLFQEGRFRRLQAYRRLRATECVVEAAGGPPRVWFSRYLPQTLVLGDAGLRDSAIHAIQACVPHARLLPGGAAGIVMCPHPPASSYVIAARERRRDGDLLVYDVEIATMAGELVERWTGLELRIVSSAASPNEWIPALLAPYLERRVAEIVPSAAVSVAVGMNGHTNGVLKRGDGKPFTNGFHLSRSHAGELTLSVKSLTSVGCDCEPVTARPPAVWRDLLGAGGFALAELVAREGGEPLEVAATRVWCAMEAVKKAGLRHDIGIVLETLQEPRSAASGWVVLGAGAARIATLVAPVAGFADPVAFAVLVAGQ